MKIHRLTNLHNTLVAAKASMSAPRMNRNDQVWESLHKILAAFDRQTERDLRAAGESGDQMRQVIYRKPNDKAQRPEMADKGVSDGTLHG